MPIFVLPTTYIVCQWLFLHWIVKYQNKYSNWKKLFEFILGLYHVWHNFPLFCHLTSQTTQMSHVCITSAYTGIIPIHLYYNTKYILDFSIINICLLQPSVVHTFQKCLVIFVTAIDVSEVTLFVNSYVMLNFLTFTKNSCLYF